MTISSLLHWYKFNIPIPTHTCTNIINNLTGIRESKAVLLKAEIYSTCTVFYQINVISSFEPVQIQFQKIEIGRYFLLAIF